MPLLHPASVKLASIQTLLSLDSLDPSFEPAIESLPPEPVDAGRDGFDEHALPRVLGTDPEILQDMRNRYLACLDRALTEIQDAAAREDSACAGFTAHRIKSSSRLVGAVGLARLLDQIETLGTVGDAVGIAGLVPTLVESVASVRLHLRRLESAGPRG